MRSQNHLGSYFETIGEIKPLLTREEQFAEGNKIQSLIRDYLRLMLSTTVVQRAVVDDLVGIMNKKIRLDRYINVAASDIAQKNRVRMMILTHVPTLEDLLKKSRDSFKVSIDKQKTKPERRKNFLRFRRTCQKIVLLLEEFDIRIRVIEEKYAQFEGLASAVDSIFGIEGSYKKRSAFIVRTLETRASAASLKSKVRQAKLEFDESTISLYERNLLLVVSFANKFAEKYHAEDLIDDLISEGNIGLMKAVVKFKPSKNCAFSTYAEWWIKQAMREALKNWQRQKTIPVQGEGGRHYRAITISLDYKKPGMRGCLGALIPSRDQDEVRGFPKDDINRERLANALRTLDERRRMVITRRFGLDGYDPATLEGVGEILGVTKERVRQLESTALGKLSDFFKNDCQI